MSQDIETIDKYDNRIIVNITQWRPIYEVIDEAYIKDSNIFPNDLSENVKKLKRTTISIICVKNNIKRLAMEQGLYAQVVKLRRKDLLFDAADKNKTESKFKFQGQSARSQLWFDLDLDWIDINFSTREPDF